MSDVYQSRFDAPDTPERDRPATVYVVAANYVDDPHPHIEAVYDNVDAAEAHRRWIGENRSCPHIAWGVHVQAIETGETPLPAREGGDE